MSPYLARRLRRQITRRRALQRLVERSIERPDLPRRKVQPGSVWAVTMVRNEADIVEHTVRHLLEQGVDGIIVADNLSDDATPQILTELAAEDPRVHLAYDRLNAYYQSRKMSYLAHLARRSGADWVVLFDADEFWFAEDMPLAEYLRASPATTRVLEAKLFDAHATSIDGIDFAHPGEKIRLDENPNSKKVAIRPDGWVWVDVGNHTALDLGREQASALRIAHVPYRSIDQWKRKVNIGSAALQQATALPFGTGHHWRDGNELTEKELSRQWAARVNSETGRVFSLPNAWATWSQRR